MTVVISKNVRYHPIPMEGFSSLDEGRDQARKGEWPLILPRPEHPISRKRIDEDALKVLYRLHHHGYLAYLVGGSVRDILLGRVPKDFDVATNAHPHEVNTLFRNSRVIGRRFRLVQVYFKGGKVIEVSTFRSRSEYEEIEAEDGTVIRADSFGSPEEDAFRRDLTINGLFYNIADFSILDYVGGLEDLRKGVIRTIGDPDERFRQDPVRMIRVIRHGARTGFTIDPASFQAILKNRDELRKCSPSRVRDEFLRDLREGMARPSLRLMLQTGLLFSLFPDLVRAFGSRHPLRGKNRQFLLALFGLVDQIVAAGSSVPDPVLLALLVWPFLRAVAPDHPFVGERERNHYRREAIRSAIHQTLSPYSFPKGTREEAVLILTSQALLKRSLRHGVLLKRIKSKRYFRQGLLFYAIEAQARGEGVPSPLRRIVSPGFLPWWPKEPLKKHR